MSLWSMKKGLNDFQNIHGSIDRFINLILRTYVYYEYKAPLILWKLNENKINCTIAPLHKQLVTSSSFAYSLTSTAAADPNA